jgi:hypothetical protein
VRVTWSHRGVCVHGRLVVASRHPSGVHGDIKCTRRRPGNIVTATGKFAGIWRLLKSSRSAVQRRTGSREEVGPLCSGCSFLRTVVRGLDCKAWSYALQRAAIGLGRRYRPAVHG